MALNTRISTPAANAQLDALAVLANSGYIRIYDGAQPATPEDAITDQTLLAELRFGATAFGSAANKAIAANSITPDASADANGTAAWCRVLQSDGATALWDGSVGTADANLILPTTTITTGVEVGCNSLTMTLPMQGA